jgi:hypothetical protein
MSDLTGKRRHRIERRWFRAPLLVLQVEVMRPYNFDPQHDIAPGGYAPIWRDATFEDLQQ